MAKKKKTAKKRAVPRTIDDLAPAPYNPRKISAKAAKGLSESIDTFADISGIVWNKRTGHLVTGHQRVEQLRQFGAKFVRGELVAGRKRFPVRIVDWPLAKEKAANVAANNPGIAGEFTADLQDLLGEIKIDFDLEPLCMDGMFDQKTEVTEDEVPEPPKKPVTKLGDVWTLGRHRVMCGDSTESSVVLNVLNGNTPNLTVTDLPYGVNYDPSWREDVCTWAPVRTGDVKNDDRADWREAWILAPGSVIYCWHAGVFAAEVAQSLLAADFRIRSQIIWAKARFAMSRGDYHWQHEPCWYAVRRGKTANFTGGRKQTTIWDIASLHVLEGGKAEQDTTTIHGTQKPIECMARPIRNHEGDVYDPFLGSGTTLIAAEQLDRICYGVELSPAYCDVIVERWQNLTGKKATRASSRKKKTKKKR